MGKNMHETLDKSKLNTALFLPLIFKPTKSKILRTLILKHVRFFICRLSGHQKNRANIQSSGR